jgi:hypothetical protein
MLALIDASKDLPSLDTLVEPTTGRINLKATLVVVPSHLVGQWERESKKFLKGVVVLKIDATTMRYTVEDLEEADIVIVSIDVLAKEPYWIQLARFAAGGSLPKLGSSLTRYWKSRVGEVLKSLGPQMDLLDRGDKAAVKEIEENIKASILKENEDLEKAKNNPDRLGMYGKKRMTGSAYARSVTIVESKVAVRPNLRLIALLLSVKLLNADCLALFCFSYFFSYFSSQPRRRRTSRKPTKMSGISRKQRRTRSRRSRFLYTASGTPAHLLPMGSLVWSYVCFADSSTYVF